MMSISPTLGKATGQFVGIHAYDTQLVRADVPVDLTCLCMLIGAACHKDEKINMILIEAFCPLFLIKAFVNANE